MNPNISQIAYYEDVVRSVKRIQGISIEVENIIAAAHSYLLRKKYVDCVRVIFEVTFYFNGEELQHKLKDVITRVIELYSDQNCNELTLCVSGLNTILQTEQNITLRFIISTLIVYINNIISTRKKEEEEFYNDIGYDYFDDL